MSPAEILRFQPDGTGGFHEALVLAARRRTRRIPRGRRREEEGRQEGQGRRRLRSPPSDLLQDAEDKIAAGDVHGRVEFLEKTDGGEPRAALRLGVLRESQGELDLAIDAYKVAGRS